MKILILLGCLVVVIILCDKFEKQLPAPLKVLYSGWKKITHALGFVMSKIILTILWIIGFGTYGIIMKIIMLFRSKKKSETYWADAQQELPDHLKYQF